MKHKITTIFMAVLLFGMSLCCWFRKPAESSESERRVLAQFPEISADAILSGKFMKDFESYTLDQFPLRDGFRSVNSFTTLMVFGRQDTNGLYLEDGYLSKLEYPMQPKMLDHTADRFRFIYEQYLAEKDNQVYFSIVPDKNCFLARESGRLSMDYEALVQYMRECTDYMTYIDIMPLLSLEDYYCTDTHWRQECITDAAAALAEGMGQSLSASYEERTLDHPFEGVYYGQMALPVQPDTIRYLTNDTLEACRVYIHDTGKPVETDVYNMEKAVSRDPYEMFLSGANALMTIENPNAKTDRELLVFRDSFGSSLVPLLCENYAKVTLVDIRYVQSGMLGNLIDFEQQDVLFLYSTLILNNSLALK